MLVLSFQTSVVEISSGRQRQGMKENGTSIIKTGRANLFCSVSTLPLGRSVKEMGLFNQISINIHLCCCTLAPSGYQQAVQ